MKPLDGLLVLDFSQFLAGPSAALRLADLGARVIKIERPGTGDLCRRLSIKNLELDGDSTLFHTINRNKESYAADLKSSVDIEKVKRLIRHADVMIENFRPGAMERLGLDYESVHSLNPDLVYGSVTGYGKVGPWRNKPGQDLLIQSLSGLAWLNGNAEQPPVPMGLAVADLFTGMNLAQGILACLVRRKHTGQGGLVEVSLLESALDYQFEVLSTHLNDGGKPPLRSAIHNAHAYLGAPYGIYPSRDGYIAIAMGSVTELGELLALPALASYVDPKDWFDRRDEIKLILANHLKQRTTGEWLEILEPAGYWSADVYNWNQMMASEGFQALDMIQEVTRPSGASLRTTRCPIRFNERKLTSSKWAPTVGEDNQALDAEFALPVNSIAVKPLAGSKSDREGVQQGNPSGASEKLTKRLADLEGRAELAEKPLEGIVVLDFSQFLSGPSAALRLADLGARVIKIERPDGGDICRTLYISNLELDGDSTLFHSINRNKESFAANLKDAADLSIVHKLIEQADVMIQNFRPGVMKRLGLDYEAVKKLNPNMIYGGINGYGDEGPWQDKPGQDLLVQSLSGLGWLNGNADQPPMPFGLAIADMAAGAQLVQAILAGLALRGATGQGSHVEVSLYEATLDMQFEVLTSYLNDGGDLPVRSAVNSAHAFLGAPYGIYATSDGFIALAMGSVTQLGKLLSCQELQAFTDEATWFTRRDEIKQILVEHLSMRTTRAWLELLEPADYWCADVLSWEDLLQHEGFKVLEMTQEVMRSDDIRFMTTRCPIRVDGHILTSRMGAPRIGEHNASILQEIKAGSVG